MKKQFEEFLKSPWALEVWSEEEIIFKSKESGVKGLLDFIKEQGREHKDLVIFDRIIGQGAALLAVYLKAKVVYGQTGSQLAVKCLEKYQIEFYFQETVANILNRNKTDLCPLEKLSFDKCPEDFYNSLRKLS
jgi:hypothetical protein